ncbi:MULTISPECIES: hypothetical protein [Dermacoccus]|nr:MULTISPECIES: hypothetical protein [Dermacoccus]MBO1758424.1 hypothetical protein [Dermacoccus sp. NHGro5]MCG7429466.1 hypothetical protein [Dermacoccus nishinomiyaensis]MCT1605236.1 hypothetical protein [Dermacoccus nishinomiyaensis]NHC31523.1 hypothetical protein [Dermacoccus nishinomiyaensis]
MNPTVGAGTDNVPSPSPQLVDDDARRPGASVKSATPKAVDVAGAR